MSRDERAHRLARAILARLYANRQAMSVSALILAFNDDPNRTPQRLSPDV